MRREMLEALKALAIGNIAKENRRYINEVVMPSYDISDAWKNPYFDNWLKSGGWKD